MNPKDWFRNAVIYQVFVDRFFGFGSTENVSGFAGGNLMGVTSKVDYLKSLGINVIWLSPFYKTEAYHGYHITDFKKVDPRFGTRKDLVELIRKAKGKGMRVIADFVPNHCSVKHPFFRDAIRHEQSPYRQWFIFEKWPDSYLRFLNFKELPKLNLENPAVREYMIEVAKYWLSLGLDGFRLDHVIGPSHKFWKEFGVAIRKKYPGAVLIGEAWAAGLDRRFFNTIGIRNKIWRRFAGVSQEKIQLEYHNELDGVLDFVMQDMVKHSVLNGQDLLTSKELRHKIKIHLQKLPPGYHLVSFLDNHDMNRFIRYCGGKVEVLLEAFELLLSLGNPVVIYYGTENCIPNETEVHSLESHSDLQVRAPLDWENLNQNFVEGFRTLVKKYRGT
jgi:glycosidase